MTGFARFAKHRPAGTDEGANTHLPTDQADLPEAQDSSNRRVSFAADTKKDSEVTLPQDNFFSEFSFEEEPEGWDSQCDDSWIPSSPETTSKSPVAKKSERGSGGIAFFRGNQKSVERETSAANAKASDAVGSKIKSPVNPFGLREEHDHGSSPQQLSRASTSDPSQTVNASFLAFKARLVGVEQERKSHKTTLECPTETAGTVDNYRETTIPPPSKPSIGVQQKTNNPVYQSGIVFHRIAPSEKKTHQQAHASIPSSMEKEADDPNCASKTQGELSRGPKAPMEYRATQPTSKSPSSNLSSTLREQQQSKIPGMISKGGSNLPGQGKQMLGTPSSGVNPNSFHMAPEQNTKEPSLIAGGTAIPHSTSVPKFVLRTAPSQTVCCQGNIKPKPLARLKGTSIARNSQLGSRSDTTETPPTEPSGEAFRLSTTSEQVCDQTSTVLVASAAKASIKVLLPSFQAAKIGKDTPNTVLTTFAQAARLVSATTSQASFQSKSVDKESLTTAPNTQLRGTHGGRASLRLVSLQGERMESVLPIANNLSPNHMAADIPSRQRSIVLSAGIPHQGQSKEVSIGTTTSGILQPKSSSQKHQRGLNVRPEPSKGNFIRARTSAPPVAKLDLSKNGSGVQGFHHQGNQVSSSAEKGGVHASRPTVSDPPSKETRAEHRSTKESNEFPRLVTTPGDPVEDEALSGSNITSQHTTAITPAAKRRKLFLPAVTPGESLASCEPPQQSEGSFRNAPGADSSDMGLFFSSDPSNRARNNKDLVKETGLSDASENASDMPQSHFEAQHEESIMVQRQVDDMLEAYKENSLKANLQLCEVMTTLLSLSEFLEDTQEEIDSFEVEVDDLLAKVS